MDEAKLIARYFAPLCSQEIGAESLQNDAATLEVPGGKKLVVTTDSVIENWHVPAAASPAQFAQKLMRRNLSDLAAMGAQPWRYTLNCNLPTSWVEDDVAAFAKELGVLQEQYGCSLIGGDTTFQGTQVQLSMTMMGLVHQPHNRTGAQVGDDIYVTGTIGDAGLALMFLQDASQFHALSDQERDGLLQRYYQPEPCLEMGQALHGFASSVMDVSDGLITDLGRIGEASEVAINMDESLIPLTSTVRDQCEKNPGLLKQLIDAGDDYELVFTAPKLHEQTIMALAKETNTPVTRIGEIIAKTNREID